MQVFNLVSDSLDNPYYIRNQHSLHTLVKIVKKAKITLLLGINRKI